MENREMLKISEHPRLKEQAAEWFHQKWGIPKEAYLESMEEGIKYKDTVPEWYIIMDGNSYVWFKGMENLR